MSRHDVAVLTLRAFALYAWFQALAFCAGGTMTVFYSTMSFHAPGLSIATILGVILPALIYILSGLFLFIRSRALASWLLPLPGGEGSDDLPPHPLGVATVAFAGIGIGFCLYALPTLVRYGIIYCQKEEQRTALPPLWYNVPSIAGSAAQFALGFFLFVKARTFATAWWRKQESKIRD